MRANLRRADTVLLVMVVEGDGSIYRPFREVGYLYAPEGELRGVLDPSIAVRVKHAIQVLSDEKRREDRTMLLDVLAGLKGLIFLPDGGCDG